MRVLRLAQTMDWGTWIISLSSIVDLAPIFSNHWAYWLSASEWPKHIFCLRCKNLICSHKFPLQRDAATTCWCIPLGTTGKVWWKSPPNTTVIPPNGWSFYIICQFKSYQVQMITYFKQVSKTLINSINIILVLHRNFIPNDNPSLLEDWEHITIAFKPNHRVFINRKRNLEAWIRYSFSIQQKSSNPRWYYTQYYLTSLSNLSSNSVIQKCLLITTSSMNMTLIASNRLQNSIKNSKLVRIEDCSLLIYQSSHFIYIILLSL